jgi:hypothetical protein
MATVIVWAHGSMTRYNKEIGTNSSRVIHPNLADWPLDIVASNVIKESLVTAETAMDLRGACHRLEKLDSTQIIDHIEFGDEESQITQVLNEHRLTPSQRSQELAIYEPIHVEPDYFEFPLQHDGVTLGDTLLYVQLNTRKLFDQIISAHGAESLLSDNHAVLLGLEAQPGHYTCLYLSQIINTVLPNLTILVAWPRSQTSKTHEDMEVVFVYVKSVVNPTFADSKINKSLQALSARLDMLHMESHQVIMPARSTLVPLICRKYCGREYF